MASGPNEKEIVFFSSIGIFFPSELRPGPHFASGRPGSPGPSRLAMTGKKVIAFLPLQSEHRFIREPRRVDGRKLYCYPGSVSCPLRPKGEPGLPRPKRKKPCPRMQSRPVLRPPSGWRSFATSFTPFFPPPEFPCVFLTRPEPLCSLSGLFHPASEDQGGRARKAVSEKAASAGRE